MNGQTEVHPLLRRPLYVFDLPQELLLSLTWESPSGTPRHKLQDHGQGDSVEELSTHVENGSLSTSCRPCHVAFKTVQEQRQHVKSDFHRYNLKLSLKQMPAVDEASFIRMIGDLDESISGSDSSDSDEESNTKDDPLSTLLKKQAKLSNVQEGQDVVSRKAVAGNAPMLWFSSPRVGSDSLLGLYRAIFSTEEQDGMKQSPQQVLQKKQLTPTQAKQSGKSQTNGAQNGSTSDPHYFLCMIGGGHFAAMIVSLIPEIRRGPGGMEERHAVVHAHKTFHRYTTRRKQGGSQSASDNAKGNAHSVGSSIRRANEAALEVEIRAILSEWRGMIDSAEMLFIRATGSTNRRTLFGPYDGQVLSTKDRRLRGFPFSTRRATQAELLRSFQELTRLKVSKLMEVAPEPAKSEATTTKSSKPSVEAPKLSEEDTAAQLHTTQLQSLIRRSRAPALLLYLTKNALSPNFLFFPPYSTENHHAPTPLHLSASTNSSALITALLTKAHADPTITNPDGKTPYDLAGEQRTRDAFRVARHTLGDNALDWNAARVPSPLSQAEADSRAQAEQSALEEAERQRRKADLSKLEEDEQQRNVNRMERKAGQGKALSSAVQEKSGGEKREEEMRGLTPEMKTRLERERRARAAEERMKRMQGGR